MPELRLQPIIFQSLLDERSFFEWAKAIDCVRDVDLVGETTVLTVDIPSVEDARELISLFSRYDLDFQQFGPLMTDETREMFLDETAAWDRDELNPDLPM